MKNVGLVANLDRDIGGQYLAEVVLWLLDKGLSPIVTDDVSHLVDKRCRTVCDDELYRLSDMMVVLGGDGTMLGASKSASKRNVPMIGINLGTLGYMTASEGGAGGLEALQKTIEGNYKTEKRMMLEASVLDDNGNILTRGLLALNDVCVLRGMAPKAKSFNLHVNNQYLDTYKADGIIIATPTGSTAYNLSAGGPILRPDMECIAITPICPHKMDSRPMVVSAQDIVSIELIGEYEGESILTLDCQENILLKRGQHVDVKMSGNYLTLIKTNDFGFYDILRKKLH